MGAGKSVADKTMHILLIEDDTKTGEYLKKGLGESGYKVDWTQHGADGLHLALENRYDLIVLDVMLPGIDGWQIIEVLRARQDVPVLFLTARDQLQDRIRGLELGADDYLVKPFSFTELLLRIRTILRRGVVREADHFHLADLELDLLRRRVTRQQQVIVLTNKEFALLHLLLRREGDVLSRAQIASEVWDMNFDSDTNVVDVAIKRLRSRSTCPTRSSSSTPCVASVMCARCGHATPAFLTLRSTLAFALVAMLTVSGAGLYLYQSIEETVMQRSDHAVLARLDHFRKLLRYDLTMDNLKGSPQLFENMLDSEEDIFIIGEPGKSPVISVNPQHAPCRSCRRWRRTNRCGSMTCAVASACKACRCALLPCR